MTNAKFYRNLVCAGLGALALSHVSLSHAGYAQLSPPDGWSGGGTGGGATYRNPTATSPASYSNGAVQANASFRVNGTAVQVPARMRVAANAGRYAADAVFKNPAARLLGPVAAWLAVAGLVYDVADGLWKKADPDSKVSDGREYSIDNISWFFSKSAACASYSAAGLTLVSSSVNQEGRCVYRFYYNNSPGIEREVTGPILSRTSSCPSGWYQTSAGCVQTPPMKRVDKDEFAQRLPDARPMPPELPGILPSAWPVEVPEIQPMFIPTGNPVPNPSYDPAKAPSPENQPYLQPGVKLSPSPTPSSPWQVDLQPVNRPADSPVPKPNPTPEVNPDGTPKPDQGDKPKEDKDERDLCEKNPDILACQKIDTEVEDSEIPKAQKTVSYQAENIWGGGSCPADKYARVGGQEIKVVDWSRDCQFVTDYVKPVALALSALIVAYILAGALKS